MENNANEKEIPMYSNWDVQYPIKLNEEQKNVLFKLTSLDTDFTSKDKEFADLVNKLNKLDLPPLAKLSDLEITDRHFKNISDNDILVVIAHITGFDLAVRTHWLRKEQSIKRSLMGTNLVYPKEKQE